MTPDEQPPTDTEATSRSNRSRSNWLELLQVGPRTVGFARQAQRTTPGSPVPTLGRSPWPLVQAAVDDMFLSVGRIRGEADARKLDPDAILAEQHEALAAIERAGIEADPRLLFPAPPPGTHNPLTDRRFSGVASGG